MVNRIAYDRGLLTWKKLSLRVGWLGCRAVQLPKRVGRQFNCRPMGFIILRQLLNRASTCWVVGRGRQGYCLMKRRVVLPPRASVTLARYAPAGRSMTSNAIDDEVLCAVCSMRTRPVRSRMANLVGLVCADHWKVSTFPAGFGKMVISVWAAGAGIPTEKVGRLSMAR